MTVTGAAYRIFGNIEFRRKTPADAVILTAARGDVGEQAVKPEEEFRIRRRIADLTLIPKTQTKSRPIQASSGRTPSAAVIASVTGTDESA